MSVVNHSTRTSLRIAYFALVPVGFYVLFALTVAQVDNKQEFTLGQNLALAGAVAAVMTVSFATWAKLRNARSATKLRWPDYVFATAVILTICAPVAKLLKIAASYSL